MSPNAKSILKKVGYVAFGVFCTLLFVYATFPMEVLQGRISKELEKQMPNAHISFDRASPYRLSGVDLEDVSVTFDAQGDKPALTLRLDRVKARLQLLPLIKKHYDVAFDVQLGDGNVSGVVSTRQDGLGVQLDASEVDLARPPLLGKLLGGTLTGDLTAKIDMTLDFADPKKSTGGGFVELKKASVGEVVINAGPMGAFTVPPTSLGAVNVTLEVKEGQLVVKNFTQKSEDLELKLTGDVLLKKQLNQSQLNLQLNYKLADSYTQKNAKMSVLSFKKGPDGFSNVKLGGTLQMPAPQL